MGILPRFVPMRGGRGCCGTQSLRLCIVLIAEGGRRLVYLRFVFFERFATCRLFGEVGRFRWKKNVVLI